jgi:hypothetical protein
MAIQQTNTEAVVYSKMLLTRERRRLMQLYRPCRRRNCYLSGYNELECKSLVLWFARKNAVLDRNIVPLIRKPRERTAAI